MTTSSTQRPTSKKSAKADTQQARKIAFQELYNRSVEESKAAAAKRRAEKYAPWRGAAKRFKGLSEELTARTELRNIQLGHAGYNVNFMRRGESFSRHFAGLSDESLSAAVRFRDEALKVLGTRRSEAIPTRVLHALGLPTPVVGVRRDPTNSAYSVAYKRAKGRTKARKFSFLYLAEEDAYAAAIDFLEKTLKQK